MSSIPNHVKQYSSDVAEVIDRHVDKIADQVRESLSAQEWIPDAIRPHARPSPPVVVSVPSSLYERAQDWVSRHKVLTGFIIATTGVMVYRGYRRSKYCRKTRRARRARNGGRLEVVVIAGDPKVPLTRSLSLDMERRGFIVYIACNTMDDELMVQSLSRPDIRPLSIDITDVSVDLDDVPLCYKPRRRRSLILLITASECRRLNRTACTAPANAPRRRAGCESKLSHPEIRHSHPVA